MEYSEQCTQESLSSCNSWAEAVNDRDLEEEKFEMWSQESRHEFIGS